MSSISVSSSRDFSSRNWPFSALPLVDFLSILDEKMAWADPTDSLQGYDAVIFGGSPEFDIHGGREDNDPMRLTAMIILLRVRALVSYLRKENIPTLGVCFGHQLIAQIYEGNVTNDQAQQKVGTYEVQLTDEGKDDPLFKNLPASFMAQYAHKDSVTSLPEDAVLLAIASPGRFSALRYGGKVYTVQFHPEVARMRREDVPYHESPESSGIIPLWIQRIVAPTATPISMQAVTKK